MNKGPLDPTQPTGPKSKQSELPLLEPVRPALSDRSEIPLYHTLGVFTP